MKFVQFWTHAVGDNSDHPKLIPACGSDGVRRVDGRWGIERIKRYIEDGTGPTHHVAYSIHQGTSFTDERPLTPIIRFRIRGVR